MSSTTATRNASPLRIADEWGRRAVERVAYHLDVLVMVYVSFRASLVYERHGRRSILSVTLAQIYYTGCEALPLVGALAMIVGGGVIINASALSFLGTIEPLVNLMVVIVVRELGPLIVALILIARSGTAIATELGNMTVNHEIDALRAMAINPLSYIVFPRLVGGIVCSLCLTFYFNVVALLGGFLVSQLFHELPFSLYSGLVADAIGPSDVALFVTKNVLNGISIFAVACHEGLSVSRSATEVPKATTRAVLRSVTLVAVTTLLATVLFYRQQLVMAVHL